MHTRPEAIATIRYFDPEVQPKFKILRGVVHGRTIELEAEPGIEDGQRVEVIGRSKSLP